MKRQREEPFTNCFVTSECMIICIREGKRWTVHVNEDIPDKIRKQYHDCRGKQSYKQSYVAKSKDESEYEPSSTEQSSSSSGEESENENTTTTNIAPQTSDLLPPSNTFLKSVPRPVEIKSASELPPEIVST